MDGAHHVRHGLDHVDVGEHRLFEHVGRVTGGAEPEHLELRSLVFDVAAQLREELLHVLDGVALGELVGLAEDVLLLVDEDGLRRGRTAVEPDDRSHHLTGLELGLLELRDLVDLAKFIGLGQRANERRTRAFAEPLLAPVGDVALEALDAVEVAGVVGFREAKDRGTERGVVLRALGDEDEVLDRNVLRVIVAALLPDLRNAKPPALLQERQVGVGAAEQEHARFQRVAAGQDREVLQDDRVGERAEHLVRGDARLDEVHDVGFVSGPEPDPVRNILQVPRAPNGRFGNAAAIACSSSITFSGCLVRWRW